MKYRTTFTVIAFLALISIGDVQTGIGDTNADADRTAHQKVASVIQDPAAAIIPQDRPESKHAPASTPVHFEPLLLLLLGSTFFSIGTAIKFVVSRKFDRKTIRAVVSKRVVEV